MTIAFSKYHGAGNDFVLIEDMMGSVELSADQVSHLCDRHVGVGSDGLIVVRPSETADFQMVFYNPDGSRAQMCGNGIRCLAKFVHDRAISGESEIAVETLAGTKTVSVQIEEGRVVGACVNMGRADFRSAEIPVDLNLEEVVDYSLPIREGFKVTAVSMGNPHCVSFTTDVQRAPVAELGPIIERLAIFPERVNVEFAQVVSPSELTVRVWERGAGETLACGTGACAVAAAAWRLGLAAPKVVVGLPGGTLTIEDTPKGIMLSGPAEFVFEGHVEL